MHNWEKLQLPAELKGRSFLEIGCWEGKACAEAVKRAASPVVGIDLCTCEALATNVENCGLHFIQMDVFSEKLWELPSFDVVLCAGVLEHVENPLALIFRLRKLTNELLFIETIVHTDGEEKPTLQLYPTNELRGNFSNWWTPNRRCLHDMLQLAGFGNIKPLFDGVLGGVPRYAVCANATGATNYRKILPRAKELMSLKGGSRR